MGFAVLLIIMLIAGRGRAGIGRLAR
jgi:hypothetical protein